MSTPSRYSGLSGDAEYKDAWVLTGRILAYTFIAATITKRPDHPLGLLIGDILVRAPSALGPAAHSESFTIETLRFGGMSHIEIQNHPDVYCQLRRICAGQQREG